MQECTVGSHDYWWEGRVFGLYGRNGLGLGSGGLVVGEDLVDSEGHVGEEEGGFDGVAAAGEDTP